MSSRFETIVAHPSKHPNRRRASTLGLQLLNELSPSLARRRQLLDRRAIEPLSHATLSGLSRVPDPRTIVPGRGSGGGAGNMPGGGRAGNDTTGRRHTADRDTSPNTGGGNRVVHRQDVGHNETGLCRCRCRCRYSFDDHGMRGSMRDSALYMRRECLHSGVHMRCRSSDSRLHMRRKRSHSGVHMRCRSDTKRVSTSHHMRRRVRGDRSKRNKVNNHRDPPN